MTTTTYTDYTITNALETEFLFVNLFLDSGHLKVYHKALAAEDFTETSDFSGEGASGSYVVTVTGATAAALGNGDTIRVRRVTPSTPLVEFVKGSLTAANLNLVTNQNLFRIEEGIELPTVQVVFVDPGGDDILGKNVGDTAWDAVSLRIENVSPGVGSLDAVNVQQVLAAIAAIPAGDTLPGAVTADDMLYVAAGNWVVGGPAVIRGNLGLGDAALKTVGVVAGVDLPSRDDGDGRWLKQSSDLSDVDSAVNARTNLGLSAAATTSIGTDPGDLIVLDGSGHLPAVDGRNLDLSAHSALSGNGGHYQLDVGTVGGSPTTGADVAFSAGGCRLKFETAAGSSVVVNGGPSVNAVSASKSWTLELTGDPTVVHEIEASVEFYNGLTSGSGSEVKMRFTETLDGTGGWTDFTFPRSTGNILWSAADKQASLRSKVFITGPALVELFVTGSGGGDITLKGTPFLSARRLNS